MKQFSFVVDTVEDLRIQLDKAISEQFMPTLGIVFSSVKLGIPKLAEVLKDYPFEFFGCSSCGEIISSETERIVWEGSCVVTLVDWNKDNFKVIRVLGEVKSNFTMGEEIGITGTKAFTSPAFLVLCSNLNSDGEQLVKGIVSGSGGGAPIYGGLAGDDSQFIETFVIGNGFYSTNGAVAVVLNNEKIEVNGIATSGWIALGAEKIVTKATGNIVYTLDNEKALDVYMKYLGVRQDELPEIGVEYPMLVNRADGSSVLRAVMAVDPDERTLIFAGTVPEGAVVKFSSSPGFEVVDFVKNDLRSFFRKLPKSDMLLLFSCMARHMAVGPMVEEEISEAALLWGIPVTGFFTYGEIGNNMKGNCDFYNETYTLVTLTEH